MVMEGLRCPRPGAPACVPASADPGLAAGRCCWSSCKVDTQACETAAGDLLAAHDASKGRLARGWEPQSSRAVDRHQIARGRKTAALVCFCAPGDLLPQITSPATLHLATSIAGATATGRVGAAHAGKSLGMYGHAGVLQSSISIHTIILNPEQVPEAEFARPTCAAAAAASVASATAPSASSASSHSDSYSESSSSADSMPSCAQAKC